MGAEMMRSQALLRPVVARSFMTTAPARAGPGMYGLSPVQTDPVVEKWAAHREDIDNTFEFTPKTNLRLGIFAILIPALIYVGISDEFRQRDAAYGADKDPNTRGNTKDYM